MERWKPPRPRASACRGDRTPRRRARLRLVVGTRGVRQRAAPVGGVRLRPRLPWWLHLIWPASLLFCGMAGGMAERFKAHAWKACVREQRTVGSNPTPSANSPCQHAENGQVFSYRFRLSHLLFHHPPPEGGGQRRTAAVAVPLRAAPDGHHHGQQQPGAPLWHARP